jgi:hypothetical protein
MFMSFDGVNGVFLGNVKWRHFQAGNVNSGFLGLYNSMSDSVK